MSLDEQHVARMQHDIANLLVKSLAVAGHGHDDGVVMAAKAGIADGHSYERAGVTHHRFNQASLRPRSLQVKDIVGGRNQATNAL